MPDVMYYPYYGNVSIEDADHHVWCNDCFYNLCRLHKSTWHVGHMYMTTDIHICILQVQGLACMIYQVINLGASLDFKVHEYTILKM